MIASWWALVRAVRRGRRLVLVPLLAVLITAHLASAAHSAPYAARGIGAGLGAGIGTELGTGLGAGLATGPGIVAACPPQHHAAGDPQQSPQHHAADGPRQSVPVVDPGHEHHDGAHVDHSVDRPRDPGEHDPVLPGLPCAAMFPPAAAGAYKAHPARERDGPPGSPSDGRSLLGSWRL